MSLTNFKNPDSWPPIARDKAFAGCRQRYPLTFINIKQSTVNPEIEERRIFS